MYYFNKKPEAKIGAKLYTRCAFNVNMNHLQLMETWNINFGTYNRKNQGEMRAESISTKKKVQKA